MGTIFAITNQKGGVGKTTTAINLSAALASKGKKVLLIDLDPQCNATRGIGHDPYILEENIYTAMMEDHDINLSIIGTTFKNLNIIGGSVNLAGADIELLNIENRHYKLKNTLANLKKDYDFIILDCPPSLGLLTMNALVASHGLIIPMQCEFFSMEGISQLLNTILKVRQNFNPSLYIEGILLTMCDFRTKFAVSLQQEVRGIFKDNVYKTGIPRNIRVVEAASKGKSIIEFDIKASGAQSYLALAKEVLQHEDKRKNKG